MFDPDESDWPRCTQVLSDMGLTGQLPDSKYLRRGALVDDACGWIALGKPMFEKWYALSSGNPDNPHDFVRHEECREYIEAYARWIKAAGWHPIGGFGDGIQRKVKSKILRVTGTVDDLGWTDAEPSRWLLIDRKNGAEEPWHRLQLGIYAYCLLEELGVYVKRANLYLPSGKFIVRDNREEIEDAKILVEAWHRRIKYVGI